MNSIITFFARAEVAAALPSCDAEASLAGGVMAGLIAASKELMSDAEFTELCLACNLNPIRVAELLDLMAFESSDDTIDIPNGAPTASPARTSARASSEP